MSSSRRNTRNAGSRRSEIAKSRTYANALTRLTITSQDGLYEQPPSMVYWPVLTANRIGMSGRSFVIRSDRAGSASLVSEVRQAVGSVNHTIPMTFEGTMQDLYAESIARTSFALVMLGIAGSMALALAVVGIYGVVAYVVSQRTREIGIRSALGAEPWKLQRLFLRHGLMLTRDQRCATVSSWIATRPIA